MIFNNILIFPSVVTGSFGWGPGSRTGNAVFILELLVQVRLVTVAIIAKQLKEIKWVVWENLFLMT